VIRNLRRFFVSEFSKEFELCSEIAKTINKPELLLLAGLFHDIAKGRGGDHASLGAQDVKVFCQHHQLRVNDIALVSGLVEHHLLMSQIAQKQDLEDFEVIDRFAKAVGSVQFLELLYLLTVADIRATKADLWNDWKDSLLRKLFYKTKEHLLSGATQPPNMIKQIEQIKQSVLSEINQQGYDTQQIEQIFSTLPKDYFLRYEVEDIMWHLWLVMKPTDKKIRVVSRLSEHNVVDIFVYGDDSKGLFFKLVSIIEKLGLDIVDAKILTTKDHKAYNTISVLQDDILEQININQEIEDELGQMTLSVKEAGNKSTHRYFDHKINISFSYNEKWNLTKVEINVIDKQGLLSNIAYIFHQLGIHLVNARITTMGERVEDIFFISNAKKQPLSTSEERLLKQTLEEKL
jgi:[protein-PII] uridylyltransferase